MYSISNSFSILSSRPSEQTGLLVISPNPAKTFVISTEEAEGRRAERSHIICGIPRLDDKRSLGMTDK